MTGFIMGCAAFTHGRDVLRSFEDLKVFEATLKKGLTFSIALSHWTTTSLLNIYDSLFFCE